MTTTIWSTTHTAPIRFDRVSPSIVQITLEDGSSQIYYVADLRTVCQDETY